MGHSSLRRGNKPTVHLQHVRSQRGAWTSQYFILRQDWHAHQERDDLQKVFDKWENVFTTRARTERG